LIKSKKLIIFRSFASYLIKSQKEAKKEEENIQKGRRRKIPKGNKIISVTIIK